MSREEHSAAIHQSEFEILRALCGEALSVSERENLIGNLEDYEWREEEHRVVFQAIMRLRRADADSLREHLPGAATRMGFPDIFWEEYFTAMPGEDMQFPELLRILREG